MQRDIRNGPATEAYLSQCGTLVTISLACPRVAGGKDGLPIWSTAADVSIINMKSQATDRRWFSR
jgi:hypothetical protein